MYSVFVAYLLWIFGGWIGLHRFYLNKIGTGLLYLFTGGLAGVGVIYDFFTLPRQVREANLEGRYRKALSDDRLGSLGLPSRPPPNTAAPARVKENIERTILRTAKTNQGIASPAEVALEGNINLEEAKKHLEKLVSEGFAEVRVSKAGKLLYVFPDFVSDATEAKLEDF